MTDNIAIKIKLGQVKKFLLLMFIVRFELSRATPSFSSQECEYPPKNELDLTTHRRYKRLTPDAQMVCLEDYPYTVSVRVDGRHMCGGASLNSDWILTAGQCFDYVSASEVTVRVGSVYRDYGGILLDVTRVVRHPSYRVDLFYPEHNLALARVSQPIEVGPRSNFVNLAVPMAELPTDGGEIIVTGYGAMTTGQLRAGLNPELRRMTAKKVDKNDCRLKYVNEYLLQYDQMCLESDNALVQLCAGDAGNPAVYFAEPGLPGTLYGITLYSGGSDCSTSTQPGIYNKVSYSHAWIDSVIHGLDETADNESGMSQALVSDEEFESNEV